MTLAVMVNMGRIALLGIALTLVCTQGCVRRAARRPPPPQYPPPHQQYPPQQYPPPQHPAPQYPPPQYTPPQRPPQQRPAQPRPAQPQPAQPPARTGAGLEITSDPPAAVLLDGRPVGVTPLTVEPLAPGQHDVTFMMPVQGNVTLAVELREGELKKIHYAAKK